MFNLQTCYDVCGLFGVDWFLVWVWWCFVIALGADFVVCGFYVYSGVYWLLVIVCVV